jgi:hypothetical protein
MKCNCELYIDSKDNDYCDDHCGYCGHGWAEHYAGCRVQIDIADEDGVFPYACELCTKGREYQNSIPRYGS